ncbi:hypothetical protein [Streptomyces griseorubiginosus]|jgi:hypothetical protein|uniref:hypothetical protein n=1 Tax=Streptomyces griseorubiginosus TaxID=67304 RepID=UPI0036A0E7A7
MRVLMGVVRQLCEHLLHAHCPAGQDRLSVGTARPAGSVLGATATEVEFLRGEFAVLHSLL